jgi:hypothetical protein
MGLIVKPDDQAPKPSCSTRQKANQEIMLRRETVHAMVKRHDDEALWDAIQARDIPTEISDYVVEQLKNGFDYHQIRRQIGIRSATDKSWKKIMAGIRQGFRVDGTAFLVHKATEMESISKKLKEQIIHAFEHGIEVLDKNGETKMIKGPSKELSMAVDAYNRLQQGFVKLGKDLGAFIDNDGGKGGSGGVTIVVKTSVPMPSQTEIDAHQRSMSSRHLPDIKVEKTDASS